MLARVQLLLTASKKSGLRLLLLHGLYSDSDIITSVQNEDDEISDDEANDLEWYVTNNDAKRTLNTL